MLIYATICDEDLETRRTLALAGVGAAAFIGRAVKPAALVTAGAGRFAPASPAAFAATGAGAFAAVGAKRAAAALAAAGSGALAAVGQAVTTFGTTSARYWRFRITAFSVFPGVAELQFAKLGHAMPTISAYLSSSNHSEIGGGTGGTGAGYAFDGADSTAWYASSASTGEWIGADFGSAIDVNVVRLRGRGGQYPTAGDVQYSSDGSTWSTAWSLSGLQGSGYAANVQGEHPTTFPDPNQIASGNKVIWQLRGTSANGGSAFSIGELQLRTTAGDASSNKVLTAVKPSATGSIGGFNPEAVQDGSGSTLWAANPPCSLAFELDSDYTIAELAIMERSDSGSDFQSPSAFSLYYSSDGMTFTSANSWSGQSGFAPNVFKLFAV